MLCHEEVPILILERPETRCAAPPSSVMHAAPQPHASLLRAPPESISLSEISKEVCL